MTVHDIAELAFAAKPKPQARAATGPDQAKRVPGTLHLPKARALAPAGTAED
jgi:hypothetical protein